MHPTMTTETDRWTDRISLARCERCRVFWVSLFTTAREYQEDMHPTDLMCQEDGRLPCSGEDSCTGTVRTIESYGDACRGRKVVLLCTTTTTESGWGGIYCNPPCLGCVPCEKNLFLPHTHPGMQSRWRRRG